MPFVSDTISLISQRDNVLEGVGGATSLLITNYPVVRFLYSHKKLHQLVEGKPVSLIETSWP